MITILLISATAFGVSLLTLFSGFGLGTLLMPVFALFFPIEVAVASTSVVHAANNLFKVGILAFAAFELVPALRALRAPVRWLPLGGLLSGLFGGLSGHQGALRAAFLTSVGLTPTQFVATQAVLALLVDAARLVIYGMALSGAVGAEPSDPIPWALVGVATVSAFAGASLGKRLLPKLTLEGVQRLVGVLLLVVGAALALGIA